MYIKLGFHNARANIGRTLMAFCVTAAAALILTVSLSTSAGFLQGQHLLLRYHLGGDIVMLPGKFVLEAKDFEQIESWRWADYYQPWQNDLPGALLRLPYDGYLAPNNETRSLDLTKITKILEKDSDIGSIYPSFNLPAITAMPTEQGLYGMVTPLRGRDLALDKSFGLLDYVQAPTRTEAPTDGAPTEKEDGPDANSGLMLMVEQLEAFMNSDGQAVCLINAAALPLGVTPPPAGSQLTVLVPTMTDSGYFDYHDLRPFNLTVAGHFMIPVTNYPIGERAHSPFYWTSGVLHIPLTTWQQIAEAVGADSEPKQVEQLSLRVTDTLAATRVANELRRQLPEYTVLTAAELAQLLEKATSQAGLPMDMDQAFHLLTVLITSLIVATNAYLLIMQRRKEIAILKSLGASQANVITLILAELAALALIASSVGFALFRLLIFNPALARFGVPWTEIWQKTLQLSWQVVGILTASAVVFGLIPALKAARTSVMEVLRDA